MIKKFEDKKYDFVYDNYPKGAVYIQKYPKDLQ